MERYEWSSDGKLLGKGKEGEVWAAKDTQTGQTVAVKKIYPHFLLNQCINKEEDILNACKHDNVVNLLDTVRRDKHGSFMVFEYMDQSLNEIMRKASSGELEIKSVMQQILRGVAYVHAKGYMHLDIKPQNVLVNSKGEVKLADFGCAIKQSVNLWQYPTPDRVGTTEFAAPELLLGLRRYGPQVDVWSAGCILLLLLLGRDNLVHTKDTELEEIVERQTQTMDAIITWVGKPDEENWPGVSRLPNYWMVSGSWAEPHSVNIWSEINDPAAAELVSKMLCLDPSKRITAQEALESDYFRENSTKWSVGRGKCRSVKRYGPGCGIPTTICH